MIISASYKTDIPSFYGKWFSNRLKAGFCRMVNPYNRRQRFTISLGKKDVDGFVFWTKNIVPFVTVLDEIDNLDFPFIVQYTINGYPRALESRVVDATKSIQSFRHLADKYGHRAVIWRYDTIIISSLTDPDFHRSNFERLATQLSGATDEVVVSFMQIYDKTRWNMDEAAKSHGFSWEDPPMESKRELLGDLIEIATDNRMRLAICTQPELMVSGATAARCIDAQRLMEVADRPFQSRLKGMRAGCGCFEAKDIGDYDTCPHGCVYCYAVRRRPVALDRYQNHDPESEFLFPQKRLPLGPKSAGTRRRGQIPLFIEREP